MDRRPPLFGVLLAIASTLVGCKPQEPFYFRETGEMSRYIGMATDIEFPDVQDQRLSEVEGAIRPFSLASSEPKEIWELKLEDAVRYCLENSKVMRSIGGQIAGPPELLTRSADFVPTIYDPAIVESNARTGVEAALAAFDAQWQTDVFWEKNHEPRNVLSGLPLFPQVLSQDTAQFQTQVTKTAANGAQFALRNNTVYDLQKNNSTRLFPADWTTNIEAEIRQPLLQGAGVAFNRIAGPGAVPGFNNGVLIARINTDIALTTFEANVRNLVSDAETAYWELYFAYRNLDAVVAGRDSALQTWRKIYALYVASAKGGEAEKEAQAREQYFLFRSSVEQALTNLYSTEAKLRYLMGLASTDGRLIRPFDEPTTAKVAYDWTDTHSEALCRAVELREAKWKVKQRELELIAAKNYLLPRLDAVGRYRWLGMGQDLLQRDSTPDGPFDSAFDNMFDGNFQDWHLELQLRVPIGFRRELSGVRNAQLALARDRAKLQETELEISHQLAFAIRDMEANLVLSQTNFNRRVAAQRQVEAVEAAYQTGTVTLDVLLQAQRLLAQAESDYFRSLVNYNRAITQVHYRKGSLLEYNGVYLAEGPWPAKAYFDAKRRARARDAAIYIDYGYTMPKVISRGPYQQHMGGPAGVLPGQIQPSDANQPMSAPEVLPTPKPVPDPAVSTESAAGVPPAPEKIEPRAEKNSNDDWQPGEPKAAGEATSTSTKSRDLGSLDLRPLAGKPAKSTATAAGWTSVITAGPQRTSAASATKTDAPSDSTAGWKSVIR